MVTILFSSYISTSKSHLMPTGICQLLGHSNQSLAAWILTIFTLLSQYLSGIFIHIVYMIILRRVGSEGNRVERSSGRDVAQEVKVSAVVAYAILLSWMPSASLLSFTLLWNRYPYAILMWATMVFMPLGAVISPFVFVLFRFLKSLIQQRHRQMTNTP